MGADEVPMLRLALPEPGDDSLKDQIMDILKGTLIGNGEKTISTSMAAERIASMMPEGRPYSQEVGRFLTVCYYAAEQIPYGSRQTHELVSIIQQVMNSSRLLVKAGSESIDTNPRYLYQKLGETLRDRINTTDPEDRQAYVSFESFQAALYSAGLLEGGVDRMSWTMDDAFGRQMPASTVSKLLRRSKDEVETAEHTGQDVYVLSAAEWIREYGAECYAQIAKRSCVYGAREIALRDWKHWKKGFESYGIDDNDGEVSAFRKECKVRAVGAAREMEKIADRIA